MIEETNMTDALMDAAGDKIAQRLRAGLNVNDSDFAKVAGLMQVQPGDLITADLMNRLLKRLALLELLVRHLHPTDQGSGDPFSVFGKPLLDAVGIISTASGNFTLGKVLDVNGQVIQTTAPGTLSRLVLGQFFVSDASTGVTTVNLLVTSANATGGFFKELGSEAKDIIAKVVYQAVETQIAAVLARNKRSANLTNDTTKENTDPNVKPESAMAPPVPAAATDESAATASSTKQRASKKAAKGSRKAAGSGDDGGVK